MENSFQPQSILKHLLARTGGWYVIIAAFFVQFTVFITILLSTIFEQLNADYTPETSAALNNFNVIGILAVSVILIVIVFILSRNMRARLNTWKQNPELFNKEDDQEAWKSANNIIWKYALSATIVTFSFIIFPKTILLSRSGLVTQDQIIYGFIAGLITNLAFVLLSTVLLDSFLVPVRQLLLPKDYSQQLSGLSKLRILSKFVAVVFVSLLITTLLIAPTGYHQTTQILYKEVGSLEVIGDLQIQSILISALAILFAISIVFLFSRSILDPLQALLNTLQKVENGDLDMRAPVISSDEVSQLAIYFNRMIARLQELQSNLEVKVEERTSRLQAINAVGRVAAAAIPDPDKLLDRVVNLITEEFGYFSAIYLIDPSGQWADLKGATGEVGKALMETEHRVKVDDSNMIGHAIRSRQAKVNLDIGKSAAQLNNTLLPYTRSEISLPLYTGDRILGALNVHSTQESAFNEEDVETLQNMANQVVISLDNARLLQETRQSLNEMRNIQKQYLRDAWIDSNLPQGGVSLALGESVEGEEKNLVEVPIALRDQIIGHLSLEGNEPLSLDEQNWIQAIATQTALALENARLLEESQSAAMREKFVTKINNKIWASSTIDGILQTAVRELGQVLDATEATIEINIDGK